MQTSYTQYWDLGLQAGKVLLGLNKSSITYVVRKENTFFFYFKRNFQEIHPDTSAESFFLFLKTFLYNIGPITISYTNNSFSFIHASSHQLFLNNSARLNYSIILLLIE